MFNFYTALACSMLLLIVSATGCVERSERERELPQIRHLALVKNKKFVFSEYEISVSEKGTISFGNEGSAHAFKKVSLNVGAGRYRFTVFRGLNESTVSAFDLLRGSNESSSFEAGKQLFKRTVVLDGQGELVLNVVNLVAETQNLDDTETSILSVSVGTQMKSRVWVMFSTD